jgi:hypothetical protein
MHFPKMFDVEMPTSSLLGFVDFLASAAPQGNVYLFGGVLRDLALFGRAGFHSDVDIVVEGAWEPLSRFLDSVGARRNKFGGYRLFAGDWPIDIWNAEDTWAIRENLVTYEGISSLTKTTVLNWDAILMNWRSGAFICSGSYLNTLQARALDVVLEENPNPLGMAVRVFRHLSAKDAKSIGRHAIEYLERTTKFYCLDELIRSENESYGNSVIEPSLYRLFALSREVDSSDVERRFEVAATELRIRGEVIAGRQFDLEERFLGG